MTQSVFADVANDVVMRNAIVRAIIEYGNPEYDGSMVDVKISESSNNSANSRSFTDSGASQNFVIAIKPRSVVKVNPAARRKKDEIPV